MKSNSARHRRRKPFQESITLHAFNPKTISYKNIELLKHYCTSEQMIVSSRLSRHSAICQRKLAKAIKQARILGLIPFTAAQAAKTIS